MSPRLAAVDVSVRLAGRPVLDSVSVEVQAGETVGLIGPNGAGKTTLLRVLAGLQPPGRGEIRLAGRPLAAIDRAEIARSIGFLPQGGTSHWDVTVETLVTMGRLPHLGRWRGPSVRDFEAVGAAMDAADLAGLARRPVTQLSGGELSRTLLARVLAGEPELLLADEPVSGLDPAHRLDAMEIMRALARRGAGVVAVLHDLSLAARFCDRLVLLHSGRKIADGRQDDVLTPGNLRDCYGIRAHRGRIDGGHFIVPIERIGPGDAARGGARYRIGA